MDAETIMRALGHKNICDRLRLSGGLSNSIKKTGKMPARWYVVIKKMCAEKKIPCNETAFYFIDDQG